MGIISIKIITVNNIRFYTILIRSMIIIMTVETGCLTIKIIMIIIDVWTIKIGKKLAIAIVMIIKLGSM